MTLPFTPGRTSIVDVPLSDETFSKIARLAYEYAGFDLPSSKASMVKSRLTRRLRALKIPSFEAYLEYIKSAPDSSEMSEFISALTTNVSSFFRENHHFELLKSTVFPKLEGKINRGDPIHIWSAGCSNGQEPYSLALALRAQFPQANPSSIKINATDIDPVVLKTASAGRYAAASADVLSERNDTDVQFDAATNEFVMSDRLKDMITFSQLNLHQPWPWSHSFDFIFCRNVMIYFDGPSQERLFTKFAQALAPESWLFIGHSERMAGPAERQFNSIGITAYQKTT